MPWSSSRSPCSSASSSRIRWATGDCGVGVGLPLRHIGPARWQAAKPFHLGGSQGLWSYLQNTPKSPSYPPHTPSRWATTLPSNSTLSLTNCPWMTLKSHPGHRVQQGRLPSTSMYHVPPPLSLSRSPCSPATGATGLSEQNPQESVHLGNGPCPSQLSPLGVLARAGQHGLFIFVFTPSCPSYLHRWK